MNRRGFLQAVAAAALAAPMSRAMKLADGLAALEPEPVYNYAQVVNPDIFRIGDIVRVTTTGEALRVTAVDPERKVVGVERGLGKVEPTPGRPKGPLYIVAGAAASGSKIERRGPVQPLDKWIEDNLQPRTTEGL